MATLTPNYSRKIAENCNLRRATLARQAHFRAVPPASYEQLEKARSLEGNSIHFLLRVTRIESLEMPAWAVRKNIGETLARRPLFKAVPPASY
eukprot:5667730-Alexandrium_andersonii.AAC.1